MLPRRWLPVIAALLLPAPLAAQMPDPPGQVRPGAAPRHEAHLFAHMLHGDYWRLYYSVSRDGLHWSMLNGGRRVFEEYRGHADICRGHDNRFYLMGNRGDDQPDINFWVSDDLITWLYYEQYPGVAYGLSVSSGLGGPWFQVAGNTRLQDWDKYSFPPKVRHGSMISISGKQLDALIKAFGVSEKEIQ